jgi:hypothetical protein
VVPVVFTYVDDLLVWLRKRLHLRSATPAGLTKASDRA